MIVHRCKLLILILVLVFLLILSGCVDVEFNITVNRDGSGKLKFIVASTDAMYNQIVDEMIREMIRETTRDIPEDPTILITEGIENGRKVVEIRDISEEYALKITERIEYGRKLAEIEIEGPLQDIFEFLSEGNLPVVATHLQDNRRHRIEINKIEEVPMRLSLTMPGDITDSNGSFSGSTARWESTSFGRTYWAESEEEAGGATVALAIVLAVIAGLVIWRLLSKRATHRGMVSVAAGPRLEQHGEFCTNCGTKIDRGDKFCSKCGSKREF